MKGGFLLCGLACVATSVWSAGCGYVSSSPPVAFSGESSKAAQTLVVATPDTPAPKGKNVIWCATFQICFSEMRALRVSLEGADPEILARLEKADVTTKDLLEGTFYTAGGFAPAIVEKIRSDMAKQFPRAKVNLPPTGLGDALAYAYLQAAVQFSKPYVKRDEGDSFTDSSGRETPVVAFGLDSDDEAAINKELARQIEVLYYKAGEPGRGEYVLDLNKGSQPSQLLLARVPPGATLADTWRDVQQKVLQWKPQPGERAFGSYEKLIVPNINYKIHHSFPELEKNPLLKTSQNIEFRLDRTGVTLVSDAYILRAINSMADARVFDFTHPFLIALRKRGAQHPYFLMWVDNAELLCKPKPGS